MSSRHKASDTVPKSKNIYASDNTCYYEYFRDMVVTGPWNGCMDLVEFIATSSRRSNWDQIFYGYCYEHDRRVMPTTGAFNAVFEQYLVGYRFVNDELVPVSSESEVSSIESAIGEAAPSVAEQLSKALKFLADRKSPDYAKSVDCAISAVEAQCRIVLGTDAPTLGQALKQIEDRGLCLHPALKSAFAKLYGFTSDAGGIRHAGMVPSDVDQPLAKFMLVACSAFVNYLIAESK